MVTLNPDVTYSPTLAYIIGVLKGDGSVSKTKRKRTGYIITLQQTREAFADSFSKALKDIGLHPFQYTFQSKKKNASLEYRVEASSKKFYFWYQTLELNWISTNASFRKEFLRGFYESEGSYMAYLPRIAIYNKDEKKLKFVEECLLQFGFNNIKEYFGGVCNGVSALMIHEKREVPRFLEIIQPVIKNGMGD